MIKYICMLVLAMLVSACGAKIVSIEPQYIKYVKEFENQSSTTNNKVIVDDLVVRTRDDLGGSILAQCRMYSVFTPLIVVSKKYWVTMSETEREMVMFHELGHCILNRGHNENLKEPNIPESIMYPYIFSSDVYLFLKSNYILELFQNNS